MNRRIFLGAFPPLFRPRAAQQPALAHPLQPGAHGARTARQRKGEDLLGYEFAIQSGDGKKLPDDVIDYYVRLLSTPHALRGCFGLYRAWDATLAQNDQRRSRRLTMPVLTIGERRAGAGTSGTR